MLRPAFTLLLVHGYLGGPDDLEGLASKVETRFGDGTTELFAWPQHGQGLTPDFDTGPLLAELAARIDQLLERDCPLVLLGHSTGGNVILAELLCRAAQTDASSRHQPALLILAGSPPRITPDYARRWAGHAGDRGSNMHSMGELAILVNGLARRGPVALGVPVLSIQGDTDDLVPPDQAAEWMYERFLDPVRLITIPGAGHHLFAGPGAPLAMDHVLRALEDVSRASETIGRGEAFGKLPGLASLARAWPFTVAHVAEGPAGRRFLGLPFPWSARADTEPTLANIEITTRCNLGCVACARTQMKLKSRHMSRERFIQVLDRLPHAWRIMLVGLGEPLMHPEPVELIRLAVARGRQVGLVTNAMQLDPPMAEALCESGLSSITFSLDAVSQDIADQVRAGSDMKRIVTNIRNFLGQRDRSGVAMGAAAFVALGRNNLGELPAIIDLAVDLGLDALMVSDLNFPSNQPQSIHHSFDETLFHPLRQALKRALARRLPVLSVWGLEEFDLAGRYLDFLLLRGEQLATRAARHSHCASPWQTVPVNVDGLVTLCDCQPLSVAGNLLSDAMESWWNGTAMFEQRRRMLSDDPPEACRGCPRF